MSFGKGGTTSQVTGYKYFMAVHHGLCRGPINELTEIRVGDLTAWSGSLTTTDFFEIDAPNLFGGNEKEGGIDGTAKLFLGAADQTIDTIVTDNIEGSDPVPGWRGVSTVFYYGLIASNNPYPKPWKFRVNRQTAGWDTDVWEPDLALINMSGTPLTTVMFDSNPNSGDEITIGEVEVGFFTIVSGPPPTNVQIGADKEATASAFASMCNLNSDALYDVTATANGATVILQFPNFVSVTQSFGNFVTITQTTTAEGLTTVNFTRQPTTILFAPAEAIVIGGQAIGYYALVAPPAGVVIGLSLEDTVQNTAITLNNFSAEFNGLTAIASGTTLTISFSGEPLAVTLIGSFATIGGGGGGASIKAMNGAHILYECVTNNVWGRGLPTTFIDEDSFLAAAQTLFNEGFGLCMKWNRQDDIDRFVSLVLQHIGGALFINRQTGLVTLKLLRDDYDATSLIAFTFENGLLDITEDESSSNDTTFNEIIVNFIDPISGNRGSLRTQNLASFQALGTLISNTTDYLGIPTAALAARISQRDLQINSGEVRRFKIKIDRAGWYISPGDVFKISVPSRGIENMILRAGAIEDGPLEDETIMITAIQDIFSLPDASFVTPQVSFWTPPDRSVRVIDTRYVDELTYFDLAWNVPPAELAAITTDSGMIKVYAEQPSGFTQDYVIASKTSLETDYVERTVAGFDAGAVLSTSLLLHATTTVVENLSGTTLITTVPIPALIVSVTDPEVQEYVELTAIDLETGAITIARGCIDTIPHRFTAGDKVWFETNMPATDFVDRSTGEIVNVKLLSRTTAEKLNPAFAPVDTVEIGGRQGRPYPPGNFDINGVDFEESQTIDGDIIFTWAHRDRITQGNFLVNHTAGSTGPEPSTTYNVRVYDDVTLLRTVTGITGITWTYTTLMAAEDGSLPEYRFEIESERDGLISWQKYDFIVRVFEEIGFDEGFDHNFNGSPATRVTSDGNVRITSDSNIRVTR
jgi:hypothetical protein